MQIITAIGEIGIVYEGRAFTFRPSFYAMSTLGNDRDLVALYVKVHEPTQAPLSPFLQDQQKAKTLYRWRWIDRLCDQIAILRACCVGGLSDDDETALFGMVTADGKYRPGAVPIENIELFAKSLMFNGIVGKKPPKSKSRRRQKGRYSDKIDIAALVYSCVANVGMTEQEAWQLTMTAYTKIVDARTPEKDREPDPDEEEKDLKEAQDFYGPIMEKRRKKAEALREAKKHGRQRKQ